MGSRVDVVVARYREDPRWLGPIAGSAIVYDKGGPESAAQLRGAGFPRVVERPNVGRESETYLHHIVESYDRLADVTVFVQGDLMDHLPAPFRDRHPAEWVQELANSAGEHGVSANHGPHLHYGKLAAHRGLKMADTWPSLRDTGFNLGDWLDWALEPLAGAERARRRIPPGGAIDWYGGACFAARRDHIHQHPVDFWRRLLATVQDGVDPGESGHYMERSWHAFLRK